MVAVVQGGLGTEFGLIALRTRRIARLIVAIGSASLVVMYAAPLATAFIAAKPARVHTLNALAVPTLHFPALSTRVAPAPKAATHAVPTQFFHQTAPPAAASHRVTQPVAVRTGAISVRRNWVPPLPVVTNSYGPAVAATPTAPPEKQAAPETPIVSAVGSEPVGFGNSTTPTAPATAATQDPAAADPTAVATTTDETATDATASDATTGTHGRVDTDGSGAAPATTPTPMEDTAAPPAPDPAATTTPPATDTATPPDPDPAATTTPPVTDTTTTTTETTTTAAPAPVTVSGTDVSLASDGTILTVTADGRATTNAISAVTTITVTSSSLTIDLAGGAIAPSIAFTGTSLTIEHGSGSSDWTVNGDGTGTVAGGGASVSFTNVTKLSAGGSSDTLHGPGADTTWTISSPNAGTVAGTSFDGFENLAGAANNKDTFTLTSAGSISGVADGGDGGYDSLVVDGHRGTITSTPSGPHAGTLEIDGAPLRYAGLEPVFYGAGAITIKGADLGGASLEAADADKLKVSPDSGTPGNIKVVDRDPTDNFDIAEFQSFTISGTTSVTINGGLGGDSVEFIGDFIVPGANLIVNAEKIKVDPGVTVNVGSGDITFNAVSQGNGTSLLGLTTTIPVLGQSATVEVDGGTITGNKITMNAFAGTLSTTATGAQTLTGSGDTLHVATVAGFANSNGKFKVKVAGTETECTYTGRDTTANTFTGVAGCTGAVDDQAVVHTDITENGSGKGVNHAAVELEYKADVNIHGASTITAGADVSLTSAVDVTSTANAVPVKGNWVSGTNYDSGDVVIDPFDNKRYSAKNDVHPSTTAPHSDSANWDDASGKGSAIAASTFISHALTHLSDTGSINAGTTGNVTLSASLKSNITTIGDATQSGSGAGIAVAVLITDSEAYIDSTAGTPVTAKSLTLTADTDNNAPTTGSAAPGGADKNGNGTSANSPTQSSAQTAAAGGKADGKSTTADGNQDVSAALGVNVIVATTKAYISPADGASVHTIDTTGGTQKLHAGSKNVSTATADGGNVKFSPDAPTLTPSTVGGTLAAGTYYYKITATFASGESLPSGEAKVDTTGATGRVVLTWTKIDGATGYKIYRDGASGSETLLATIGDGNTLTYNDNGSATPDGTHHPPTDDANSGIGIGVAVDVAVITTSAYIGHNVSLKGSSVTAETTAPAQSAFKSTAISGAGGSSVGVAGSVSVNVVVSNTTTDVEGANPVNLNGADLTLTAASNLDNEALADAKQATDGSASGVGASVAVNVVNDTTTAGIANGTQVDNVKNLTITSIGNDTMVTTANGGASSGSGTVAFSAQVAIAISNVTTTASIGTGAPMTITGALTAHATQTAKVTTKAKGSTKGGNAGIGLSLALEIANHDVESNLSRNLTAAGNVSFQADGSSTSDTESTASSAGAKEKQSGGSGDTDSSGKDVNKKADDNAKVASDKDSSGKTTGTKTPDAKSGEGGGTKVTVAAAVAIAIVNPTAISKITPSTDLTTTGAASFKTSEDADSTVKASASATKAETANIGAAVAINDIHVLNEALVSTNDLINSHGLTVSALMNSSGGANGKNSFETDATSGGGGGKVGIAGSLALTIADVQTNAEIQSNSARGPPGDQLNGSDLTVSAASSVDSNIKAKAKDDEAKTVGIGAGVGINIVNDTTTASIDSGATFSGSSKPKNVTVSATDTDSMNTYAEAGTDGAAGSDAAITPDVAISYPTVVTSATIAGDATQSLSTTGTVSVTATQDAKTTTTAKADAGGADVSIGLALALAIVSDDVHATIARNIDGGAVTVSADGSSNNVSEADASAKGAKTSGDDGSGKDVNGKADEQLGSANSERKDNTGKDASTTSTPKAATGDKGGSSSTSVQVAAAVAINVITTSSLAQFLGGVTITSTGVASAKTTAATTADATAKGETVGTGSSDGIGVGVSINLADITNKATTGTATINATGLDVEALMADKNNGRVRRWDNTSKEWVLVEQGTTLPYDPSNGDYFQLTKGAPASSLVDGASQDVGTSHQLKVKSTLTFPTAGTFTVVGLTGECTYTGTSGGNTFTGISGCTGTPEDKAIVTSTTGTTVNGANQTIDASNTTLNVASTANFATSGSFTVTGANGTCSYTGKTAGSLTGISGCTGKPDDLAKLTIVRAAGVYKWNGSDWVVQSTIGHGTELPSSPAADTLFRLAEHEIIAEANAGAGKTDVGIAGAVAINIVLNDHTQALVGAGSHVTASSANVTVKAQANELDLAKADTEAEDAKSVGVGAAVALNVLTSTETRAEVENGAILTGGVAVDVEALSRRQVETEVVSGASGDDTTVAPGVALLVNTDEHTTARLGTAASALTATGAVTVKAEHEAEYSSTAKATAAGSTAVGASIALNIVPSGDWSTLAEIARDVTGASVDVIADSSINSEAKADATATGADSSDSDADKKKQDQVDNNPNTNGKTGTLPTAKNGDGSNGGTSSGNSQTGSQGGDSNSGDVGVAASISLNWVASTNIASIAANRHVTATSGHVKVSAEQSADESAKSTGLSYSVDGTHVAAAVGVNVADITNTAKIGTHATIEGDGITVEALNKNDGENDFIVWGMAAAGGASSNNGGASVAGSIGVEVVLFHTEASVGKGSQLTSHGELEVNARNKIGLQNLALAGGGSAGGAAVGGAIAVNVFPDITTEAIVDSNGTTDVTHLDAEGDLTVSAQSTIKEAPAPKVPLITLPDLSSVALAGGISTGGAAVSGSVIVDVFFITTEALIGAGAQVTGANVAVTAEDHTSLTNLAGGLNFSTSGAGVGVGIVVDVIEKQVTAQIGPSATVTATGGITVSSLTTENFHHLAVDAGGSSSSAAFDGSIIVVVFNASDDPVAKAEAGGTLHAAGTFSVTANDTYTALLLAGGLAISTSSAGIALAVIVIDRHGRVDAGIDAGSNIQANSGTGLTVAATQHEDLTLIAVGGGGGSSVGIAGSADINIQKNHSLAHIDSGVTINGAALGVAASDTTTVLGLAGSLSYGGTAGVGAGVDVEDLSKDTEAWIASGGTATLTGNATIDATSTEDMKSISVGGGFGGTAAVNVNAAVSVIDVTTNAYIADGTLGTHAKLFAGGSVRVAADETLTLDAIAGNLSGGGTAAVGASVAVPVVTKNTHAYIGNFAEVNGAGGSALPVKTGNYSVSTVDTRFDGATAVAGDQIDLGADGERLKDGQAVIYDNGGGTSIGGLIDASVDQDGVADGVQSRVYIAHTSDGGRHVSLTELDGTPISLTPGAGKNQRLVPTDQAGVRKDESPRFDANSDVDYGSNTFNLPYAPGVGEDDQVVYSAGGGTPIGGLVDGGTYYAHLVGGNSIQLRDKKSSDGGTVIDITDPGPNAGRSHSIVKQDHLPAGDASAAGPRNIQNPTDTFRGVAVTATNSDDLAAVGVSAGIAGTAAVSISGVITVFEVHTDAHIGSNAKVNCATTACLANVGGADGAQSVRVASANQFYQLGITATLAIAATAGVAVPVGVRLVKLNSDASVGANTAIFAARDITITSNGKDTGVTVVAGAGGGLVGVAGSVSVTILNTHTYASTGDNVKLHAGGNVLVSATEPTKLILVVASIAGGFVGVGAAVGVLSGTKDTRATIGTNNTVFAGACCTAFTNSIHNGQVFDSGAFGTLPTFSGVAVQATSSEDIFGITVSAAGGFVGVAVGVGVTLMDATTMATIGDGIDLDTNGGVNVSAVDYAKTLTIGGGAAGGFVGVGGGVDIGVLNITVAAQVGTGTIDASTDVDVNALSRKNVRTIGLSLGAGFVGAAGSVAVWTVGTQATTTYSDEGNSKDPLSTDNGSATSNADNTATSKPEAWHSGGEYKARTIVSDGGTNYVAKNDIVNKTIAPGSNPSEWDVSQTSGYGSALNGTSGSSGSDTAGVMNGHINNTESKSNTKISSNTPSTGPTQTALSSLGTVQGTKAVLNASVTTNGGVHVRAIDRTDFNGLAGAAAGGLVGVGASVLIMSMQTATEAQIGGTSTISAGGDVLVQAAQNNEQIHGIAFTGAAGLVAVGGEVVVINDTSSQYAHIDTGAKIKRAGGGVAVTGHADRHGDALVVGVGIGAAAAGVSIALITQDGDTTATIGNVAVGTDVTGGTTIGSLSVNADADISPNATAYSVQAGVGAGLSGAVAIAKVKGTTSANSGAHGSVGSGSTALYCGSGTGVCINAKGTHTGVEANSFNVVTGAFALGITRTEAVDSRSTEAIVTGGTISAGGEYQVVAYSSHHAVANAPSASGGAVSLTAMLPTATISGHTKAELDGSVSSSASITVRADSENSVDAHAFVGSISVVGASGAVADAEVKDTAYTDALVGGSLTSGGAVTIEAKQHGDKNKALATAKVISAGGIGALAILVSTAKVGGRVKASLDGSVDGSASVYVHADSTDYAEAETLVIVVGGFAGAGSAAVSEITTAATTEALIGSGATTIASGGQIHVEAHSANTAYSHDEAAAGGVAAGAINWPSADVNGHTKAGFDGNVTSGSSILVEATGSNFANAESFVVGVGAIALGGAKAEANVNSSADIEALAGSTAGANVSGSVQIKATGSHIATAKTQGTSIGVVSLNIFAPITKVDAGVKATYDGTITDANSLLVQARGQDIAFSYAHMFQLSIVGGSGAIGDTSLGSNADTEA
ncbi:MAG TPA: hypothetical protein VGQ38_20990, partial [Gaiellaceae bacterium]|nr:hypothetical protein [Gaiellaceae bacterium]